MSAARKAPAKARPPKAAPVERQEERHEEGWEDFNRKREWFLQQRDIGTEQSRTAARLAALAHAARMGSTPVEAYAPTSTSKVDGHALIGASSKGVTVKTLKSATGPGGTPLLCRPVQVEYRGAKPGLTLQLAIAPAKLKTVIDSSIRVFALGAEDGAWHLVPRSGFVAEGRYAWAALPGPGIYSAVGLPGDEPQFKEMVTLFNQREALHEAGAQGERAMKGSLRGLLGSKSALASRAMALPDAGLPEWQLLEAPPQTRDFSAQINNAHLFKVPGWLEPYLVKTGWWKLGPRNFNGRIKSLAIHPVNGNVLLAGAANGGVWRTFDGGASWNACWFSQESMAIGAIAFAPSNGNIVYAATGEDTPDWGPSYGGAGIFRSANLGSSWTLCTGGPGNRCTKLLVHPTDPNRIYVSSNTGFYTSGDGGGSWALLRGGHCTDALIDPTTPQTLYLAVWNDRVYKSLDGGSSWNACIGDDSDGVSDELPTGGDAEWIKLAMAGPKANHGTQNIYAKMGKDSGKVYFSFNGGSTWRKLLGTHGAASYNEWTNLIAVHPGFPKKIWAGGVNMDRTKDRVSWNATTGTHSDHQAMVFHPTEQKTCFVATDGGVYRSIDDGINFHLRSFGMVATQFYSVGVAQEGLLRLGGATQDQGILMMNQNSELDWHDTHAGNEGGMFVVDPNDGRNIYTTPWSNDLRRSQNGGATWADIRSGMTTTHNGATTGAAVVRHLAVQPDDSEVLVAGGVIVVKDSLGNETLHTSRLYRSTNQGDSWSDRFTTSGDVTRVAFAPSDASRCYAVTNSGNVYRSNNGGSSWALAHTAANKPRTAHITSLAVSWSNADVLYIGFGEYSGSRIMRSGDGGANWENRSGTATDALPDIPVNSIALRPGNSNVVYIATDIGVFRSLDGGATWQDFNDGWAWQDLPRIIVSELVVRRSSKALYASTMGRGIYRRSL